jgi:NADH-quinone oxidoreductase subunit N
MPLDEAGEQALAERLHHGIGVPALEGVKGAVVGESPVGRQEVWVWMTGVPVTAGFVGKFYLFNAAVSVGGTGVALAIVGVVMSVVSAYYYLGVAVAMYMRDPVGEDEWSAVSPAAGVALAVSVAVTLLLGVFPAPVLTLARLAARSLVS